MSDIDLPTRAASGPSRGGMPAGAVADTARGVTDTVEVRLPASGAYLSLLRAATAGLAARLDFTLDEIEDLRIAVDEACALLLPQAVPGGGLTCVFVLDADALDIHVSTPTARGVLPERDTFAWTVLTALAGEVDAGVTAARDAAGGPATVWVRLHKRRGTSRPA